MAKGNLFQGMGRGKVGDVVFSRLNGEQVSRVRNRHPKNPQTNKQLVQRAIMATIMSAYSAGREIFDHSFQGYSVGAGCQRRFLSLNANALRALLAAEWDTAAAEESLAKVTAPKIQTPIPNQYVVSEGSLQETLFKQTIMDDGIYYEFAEEPQQAETIAQYAARLGMNAGDIHTFVWISTSKDEADVLYKALGIASVDFDTIFRGSFGWIRLIVKNLASVNTPISAQTKLTDLFDVEMGGNANIDLDTTAFTSLDISVLVGDNGVSKANGYALGVIKSRKDVDLRSNCTLSVYHPDEFGLYWNDLLTAWKAGTTQIGASDLILEGGDE